MCRKVFTLWVFTVYIIFMFQAHIKLKINLFPLQDCVHFRDDFLFDRRGFVRWFIAFANIRKVRTHTRFSTAAFLARKQHVRMPRCTLFFLVFFFAYTTKIFISIQFYRNPRLRSMVWVCTLTTKMRKQKLKKNYPFACFLFPDSLQVAVFWRFTRVQARNKGKFLFGFCGGLWAALGVTVWDYSEAIKTEFFAYYSTNHLLCSAVIWTIKFVKKNKNRFLKELQIHA